MYSLSEFVKHTQQFKNNTIFNITKGIVDTNALDTLGDYLINKRIETSITDDEIRKYNNRPKLMSYDIYGTTLFYYILLYVNNMNSESDFILKNTVYIITKDTVTEFIKMVNKLHAVR